MSLENAEWGEPTTSPLFPGERARRAIIRDRVDSSMGAALPMFMATTRRAVFPTDATRSRIETAQHGRAVSSGKQEPTAECPEEPSDAPSQPFSTHSRLGTAATGGLRRLTERVHAVLVYLTVAFRRLHCRYTRAFIRNRIGSRAMVATTARETTANSTLGEALITARAQYAAANPKSQAMQVEAARYLPGGNTRTTLFHGPYPLRFVKGEGCRLWDADGHDYVDFVAEYTAGMFGHSHPAIRRAIESALDFGINIGGHTQLEVTLARAVTERFPSIESVRFTNSGTEANLMNIAAARVWTKRSKIMVMRGGYHGGVLYFRHGGAAINAPFETVLATYNDIEGAVAMARANAADLACILLEPMFGSTGCIPADRAFLHALRDVTTEIGALLIFDEVMTSRLAPGGLQSVHGISPDLTTLGKYVGGGMSFGAFGGRADIMALFDPARPDALPHAGTFNNNVLTMSAGIAAMEVLTPETVIAVNARCDALRERLNGIARAAGATMQFTGRGSMLAVHFLDGPIRNEADADRGNQDLKELFYFDLLERGVYMTRRGMIIGSLAQDSDAFAKLESAVEEFVRVRRRFL